MAAVICSGCERPAVCSCVCAFPLPLLCDEHRLSHATDSHFPLPLNALRHVQNSEKQAELNEQVSKLRRLHSLVDLYNDPQQQPTIDIRDLLIQFYKDVEDLKAKVKELKAESVRGEEAKYEWTLEGTTDILSALIWSETCPENELGTWMNIGHALSLKARFQYEESCRVLEDRWKLVQSNKQVEVLVLRLILSEVMGLHIGRFEEALAILERSLEVANELYPKSEIALQLANMKSAIFLFFFISKDCLDFWTNTVLNFCDASVSEISFGTSLYFYMIAKFYIIPEHELRIEAIIKEWTLKTENSSNNLIEHIRLCLHALLKRLDYEFKASGDLMKAAEELAKRDFPTSIYAALSWFVNFSIRDQGNELIHEADFAENEILRTHFPASLLRAIILEPKVNFHHRMNDKVKELEVRLSMHQLLIRIPHSDKLCSNLRSISYLYPDNAQATLDIYESTYHLFFERFFASDAFSDLEDSLRILYIHRNLPEKKFEMFTEVTRKLQATDPTRNLLCGVLQSLSNWSEDTLREKARQMCFEIYQFLRDNYPYSNNYFYAVRAVGNIYMNLKQRQKVEEIFLESVQIVKTFYEFKGCVQFIYELANYLHLDQFTTENKMAILDEVYTFLISNISPDCLDTADKITRLFSDQPEKLLTILLAVYRTLLASPTDLELDDYLRELTTFYHQRNQLDKEIETRLEAHQLLLDHIPWRSFLRNVEGLVSCYLNQNQKEKAFQFQMEMTRLMFAHSTSYNYSDFFGSLIDFCREENRPEVTMEICAEAYRALQPATNPQHSWILRHLIHYYGNIGSGETAILIVQECTSSIDFLTKGNCLSLFQMLYVHLKQFELIVDMYIKAIQLFYENRLYSHILEVIFDLFSSLYRSKAKQKAIEKLLEIYSGLKKNDKYKFEIAMRSLLDFLAYHELDEGHIAIRKKVFQLGLPFNSYDFNLVNLLEQIGRLYLKEGEREKAEVCVFRAARIALSSNYYLPEFIRVKYRTLYNGD